MEQISTQQEKKKGNPNPSPDTRFGAPNGNPRNPGGWDKTQSISYQYNRLMRLKAAELDTFIPQTVAEKIALMRVREAMNSLPDVKEITDRTEGKASQSIDVTSGGEPLKTALVEFIGLDEPDSGKDQDSDTG